MAEAYGKLTGPPGICFVTRGPGATNAAIGMHTAFPGLDADDPVHRPGRQRFHRARGVPGDRLPAHVRAAGEMGRADRSRRSRSRVRQPCVSYGRVAGAWARSCWRCRKTCCSRPPRSPTRARYQRVAAHPGADATDRVSRNARAAQRPFVMLGGGGWNAERCDDLRLRRGERPARGCAFRCQDLFDNRIPTTSGDIGVGMNPALAAAHEGRRPAARRSGRGSAR